MLKQFQLEGIFNNNKLSPFISCDMKQIRPEMLFLVLHVQFCKLFCIFAETFKFYIGRADFKVLTYYFSQFYIINVYKLCSFGEAIDQISC